MNNRYKTAVLIQAHKPIKYFYNLAKINPSVNFYVHIDKKSNFDFFADILPNVFYIEDRVDVKWGGFSQVLATISLFREALKNIENQIFHLVSGDCIFLTGFDKIASEIDMDSPSLFINFKFSRVHRHRTRFFAVHSDTYWQRKIMGKCLTKLNKLLDYFPIFSFEKNQLLSVYGSQWFSGNRLAIEQLIQSISYQDIEFFRKKLCPDEHFFQYVLQKNGLVKMIASDNRRYIEISDFQNHPSYLDDVLLSKLLNGQYWIARKVKEDTALKILGMHCL